MKKKIVFLWIGRLGDLAVSLRLISGFRKKYHDCELIFFGTVRNIELARISGLFDYIYTYPLKFGPISFFKIIYFYYKHIFFKKYFMVIDLNPSYSNSSHFIMKFIDSLNKVSFLKSKNVSTTTIEVDELMPIRKKYREMAKKLNIDYDEEYRLDVNSLNIRELMNIKNNYPVIGIFAGNFLKVNQRWPLNNFFRLTSILKNKFSNLNLFYICDRNEFKIIKKEMVYNSFDFPCFVCKDLIMLCRIIKSIDLLLTNNTAPLHISELLDTPTVSINTIYNMRCWLPEKDNHFYVVSNNWSTCRDISVEDVFNKIVYSLQKLGLKYE